MLEFTGGFWRFRQNNCGLSLIHPIVISTHPWHPSILRGFVLLFAGHWRCHRCPHGDRCFSHFRWPPRMVTSWKSLAFHSCRIAAINQWPRHHYWWHNMTQHDITWLCSNHPRASFGHLKRCVWNPEDGYTVELPGTSKGVCPRRWISLYIWGFPEIGLPPNHPFLDGILLYQPAIGVTLFMESLVYDSIWYYM